jgi:hypothetical protein
MVTDWGEVSSAEMLCVRDVLFMLFELLVSCSLAPWMPFCHPLSWPIGCAQCVVLYHGFWRAAHACIACCMQRLHALEV